MPCVLPTINGSALDSRLNFYRDLLGLPVAGQVGEAGDAFRIAFLGDARGTRLELIQGHGAPQPSEAISVGIVPRDLEAALEACSDTVQGPVSPNPHTTFWFVRDPDGYRVQLLAEQHSN